MRRKQFGKSAIEGRRDGKKKRQEFVSERD